MFKNHPKGLLAASLSNMGERFGFYIMMAILVLFLMGKYGLDLKTAGGIYSGFYFAIYALALVGGIIADKTKQYKNIIAIGIVLMAVGYLIIAIPTSTPVSNYPLMLGVTCLGLFIIAFGNGLFKGNLQALVGQLYDENPEYANKRDEGFSLFYMFINVGAIFAPIIAVLIRNLWLKVNGFLYDATLPALCHQQLEGTINTEGATSLTTLAKEVSINGAPADLNVFANEYLNVFNTGFHYAFGIAIVAMLISLVVFLINKKKFPDPANKKVNLEKTQEALKMDANEIKKRLYALFAVFGVVIFFWFSFHQNGLTLTSFAKDFTDLSAFEINFFNIVTLKGAELFQIFNPLFVVCLTPIVIGLFGWLRAKGKEPSAPKKIAIGMGIAAIAYLVMTIGSLNLPSDAERIAMGGNIERVAPTLLIGTYLILTIAELFISPLGLSFVSKVAPPHLQGVMQGCWLGATAIGNSLLFIGAIFYEKISLSATWAIFVGACLISMFIMLAMLRWLERITK